MGSTRLPNLSLNGSYIYYKNIFNNKRSFWYYYYFFFFFTSVVTNIFNDALLFKFSKNLFFNNFFKIANYQKNSFFLGLLSLYKIQNWLVIKFFLYNSISLKNNFYSSSFQGLINLKLILKKKKMNYKVLIK